MANQPSSASRTGRAAPLVSARGSEDESLPGVAALDPAPAIRPSKTDDGDAFEAPRIVARRNDEAVRSAGAPEVAAEFDRPGLASRPEAEVQRPVAPGAEVAKPKRLLWVAAAVVLGIVLAVAGVAILMVEQNARQALAFASRGFVLANGQNRFTGTGAQLIADKDVAKSFLGG